MSRAAAQRAKWLASGALLLVVWTPGAARGQQPTGSGTQSTTNPAPPAPVTPAPKPTTLADFSWLAGRWQGTWGPRVAQQVWMPPKAGVMLGTFQLTENDKTLVIELFSLVESPQGIEFHVRHFTPALVAWEKSGQAVLNLASADAKTISFENPVDGQPKNAILKRLDPDTFVSRSEIVPDKGDMQVVEITYRRQRDVPSSHR